MVKTMSVVVYVNGRATGCVILEPVSLLKYYTKFNYLEAPEVNGMITFTDTGNVICMMHFFFVQ